MLVIRYIDARGVTYREDEGAWEASLPVGRVKAGVSNEVDLLKAYIDAADRSSTVFIDDDHPTSKFTGLDAFENHLKAGVSGRLTAKIPQWQ